MRLNIWDKSYQQGHFDHYFMFCLSLYLWLKYEIVTCTAVKLPVGPEKVTLGDFKNVLNRPNFKFFFKSMDDDFGVVKVLTI